MSTAPMPDPTQAADPNNPVTQRILALIAAHQAQQTAALPAPSVLPPGTTMSAQPIPPQTQPMVAPQGSPMSSPTTQQVAASLPQPQAPQVQQAPSGPGPIRRGLTAFLYGGGQALLQHAGLPTDYEKQQTAAKLAISQQAANDNSQYRQALTDLTTGKSAQLDAQNQPYTFGTDNSIPTQLRGQTFPSVVASGLLKVLSQNQGKTDVANIAAQSGAVKLTPEYASRLGMPQLAGQTIPGKQLASMNRMLQGTGANIVEGDIGNGHVGLIDKDTQKVLQDYGPSQRILTAGIQANLRPVQTANEDGSTTYDSAAHAIATHAAGTQGAPFQAVRATLKDFTSGKDAGTLNAINTARGHTEQGIAAVDALNNGDIPALNRIAQFYHVQTGSSAPLVFNSIKNALEGEISKSLTGAGATVSEIAKVGQDFSNAGSPQQLKDVFAAYGHLLDTKKGNLADQFKQGMQGKPNFGTPPAVAPPAAHPFFSQFGGSVKQ